jgi:hypothetical protein
MTTEQVGGLIAHISDVELRGLREEIASLKAANQMEPNASSSAAVVVTKLEEGTMENP